MSVNFNDGIKANPMNLPVPANNFNYATTTGYKVGRYGNQGIRVQRGDPNAVRPPQMTTSNMSDMSKRMLPCKTIVQGYDNQRVKRRPPAPVQLYPPNVGTRDVKKGIAIESEQKLNNKILPVPSSFSSTMESTLGATD